MAVIIDIVIVGIILLFVLVGIKRGFIKEIVSLVGVIIAAVLAVTLSGAGSTFIYDSFIDGKVQDTVSNSIVSAVGNDAGEILENIPQKFITAGEGLGINVEELVNDNMGETVEQTASSVASTVSVKIVRPIISGIIRVVLFILIFIIAKILIGWLGRVLNIIAKLPVIGGANTLLGGVVGFIRGIIFALILCFVVIIIVDVKPTGLFGITSETVENSVIFDFLAGILR